MGKSTLTFSGILTLFFSIVLFVVSFFAIGSYLELEFLSGEPLLNFVSLFQLIFIIPIYSLLQNAEILKIVLAVFLMLYAIIYLISGIMQLKNRKAVLEKIESIKKLNTFVNILRALLCVIILLYFVCTFINEDVSLANQEVAEAFGFDFIGYIVAGLFLILGILVIILPTVGYSKLAKSFQNGDVNEQQNYMQNDMQGNVQNNMQGNMQNYMPNDMQNNMQNANQNNGQYYEGPVYQEQYYAYNDTQPIDPNNLITDQTQQGGVFNLIPGRDGIPANITQKGLEDLARLERLRASGAIDERNYLALKQKICSTNLG